MKVNFVLPTLNPSGGVKMVRQYCEYLNSEGHDCLIWYPAYERGKHLFSNDYVGNHIHPYMLTREIRSADITIATAWNTAVLVKNLPEKCGEKAYFIQHYESIWNEQADETYKYPLHQIVVSVWLFDLLQKRFGTAPYICENGIKLPGSVYKNAGKHPLKILMPYRLEEWKGTEDGLYALKLVKGEYPDVEIDLFGWKTDWNKYKLEFPATVHENPTDDEVNELYYNADIFVSPSRAEGFGLPALEAMARMCAVVTTCVGAVPEYTHNGTYAYITPPYDPRELATGIMSFIENDQRRLVYQKKAHWASQLWSFDKAAKRFEECLTSLVQ